MNEIEKIKPKPLEFSLDGENYMLGAEVGYVLGQRSNFAIFLKVLFEINSGKVVKNEFWTDFIPIVDRVCAISDHFDRFLLSLNHF